MSLPVPSGAPDTAPIAGPGATPTASDPSVAPAAVTAHTGGDYTTKTKIGSLNELRVVAPRVYKQMMLGIAQSICKELREHMDRLKKLMREGRR